MILQDPKSAGCGAPGGGRVGPWPQREHVGALGLACQPLETKALGAEFEAG